jgi:hypothetical protein
MSPDHRTTGAAIASHTKVSKIQMAHETAIHATEKLEYHEDNLPIPVCKLVAEESGKSDVLDKKLPGGLCGLISASGSGANRDQCNRHSATDVGAGRGTTSGGVLFGNVLISSVPLASGMSCSCVVISTPSVSIFDDESPSEGLSNSIGGGIRRLTTESSEGNEEKEARVDAGMPSTSPRRRWEVEPVA